MTPLNLLKIALGTALTLSIPLLAKWPWSPGDFIFMSALLFGAGTGFLFLITRSTDVSYKIAGGITALTAFMLVWINAAVGIIGDDNPANMLYILTVLMLVIGAAFARLKPKPMSNVLLAVAIFQAFIPFVGLLIMPNEFTLGIIHVFLLNGFFVLMWGTAAVLFRDASK